MKFLCLEDSILSEPESDTSEVLDPFRVYLHEVSKYPLMTREEEREMALRARMEGDKDAEREWSSRISGLWSK